jgi:hypothetical protein
VLDALTQTFARGDLDEALRLAIPLGEEGAEPGGLSLSPGLTRRERLEPGAPAESSGAVLGDPERLAVLRQHYRRAFERLAAEGRHREAAFVLAELLGERERAVLHLEASGEHRLAAELAEASELDPELRARLWLRAGDRGRAVEVARRARVFGAVVEALRGRDPELSRALARAWAESAAEEGDVRTALDADPDHPEAAAWLERGLGAGGLLEASLLPLALSRLPDQSDQLAARFEAILAAEDADAGLRFARLAEGLAQARVTRPVRQMLAAPLARRWAARGVDAPEARATLEGLSELGDDPLLRATLPRAPVVRPVARNTEIAVQWEEPDRGRFPILDAVRLQDGRWVLALGADGRRLAHRVQVPVSRLHVAPAEHRAVGLHRPRDASPARVALVDLIGLGVSLWSDFTCRWGEETDGREWAVVLEEGREAALVALPGRSSSGPRLTWRSRARGVRALWWRGRELHLVREDAQGAWYERHDIALDRLAERTPLPEDPEVSSFALGRKLYLVGRLDVVDLGRRRVARLHPGGAETCVEAGGTRGDGAYAVLRRDDASLRLFWSAIEGASPRVRVDARGARALRCRAHADLLVVFDDRGRAAAFRGAERVAEARS